MRLYFVRHGESVANSLGMISNRNLPHPLTEAGRRQVMALAEKLKETAIFHIFTSPIARARETAEILATRLSIPMECTNALREPDCGILEGRTDEAAWEEHSFWQNKWLEGNEQDRGPDGGETFNGIRERFTGFVKSLTVQYGKTKAGILLVTHGALLLYNLPALCPGAEIESIFERGMGYCASITIELQNGKLPAWVGRMVFVPRNEKETNMSESWLFCRTGGNN